MLNSTRLKVAFITMGRTTGLVRTVTIAVFNPLQLRAVTRLSAQTLRLASSKHHDLAHAASMVKAQTAFADKALLLLPAPMNRRRKHLILEPAVHAARHPTEKRSLI